MPTLSPQSRSRSSFTAMIEKSSPYTQAQPSRSPTSSAAKTGFLSSLARLPTALTRAALGSGAMSSGRGSSSGSATHHSRFSPMLAATESDQTSLGSDTPLLGLPSNRSPTRRRGAGCVRRRALLALVAVIALVLLVWPTTLEQHNEPSEPDFYNSTSPLGSSSTLETAESTSQRAGLLKAWSAISEGSGSRWSRLASSVGSPFRSAAHSLSSALPHGASNKATQSCELCVVDPHNPLCEYGIDNIRQSRHFTGSGYRVRRFMEKALRGENVSIGIMGASVTAGHGVLDAQPWHARFTEQMQADFPNIQVHVGAEAGMNSKFFAYCFDSVLPRDLDMYVIELDINNDPVAGTFFADDYLYRGLMGLPQAPAVVRVSVFALWFSEMMRGFVSSLGTSSFFDVPIIGIRNWILPHIIKNPSEADKFFSTDWAGTVDYRHIGRESHRALGDMLAIYMKEQKCEAERRQIADQVEFPGTIWPKEESLGQIPRLHLWDAYSVDKVADPVIPTCQFVASETAPLLPIGTEWTNQWRKEEWNGKQAWTSSQVGATISFKFKGSRVGIFVWSTNGAGNAVKPGQARCWIDYGIEKGVIVDAFTAKEAGGSSWTTIADGISFGEHVITCEILPSSSTDGHDFRILGVANN